MLKAKIFTDISELMTLAGAAHSGGRRVKEADLEIIKKAALVVVGGKIAWLGEQRRLPKDFAKSGNEISMQKQNVFPGFVECHTHALFAGSRSQEFELRNQGVSYQEIAARGGGILATMRATRDATGRELKVSLERRVGEFVAQGVTTLEVKTGYALDLKHELKCLRVLKEEYQIQVVPTYLGAHAIPPEFRNAGDYLDFMARDVLPQIKKRKLSQRVDIFIERGFFSFDGALDYLQVAKDLGFKIAIHADQLSLCGGADAACMMGALSADHLLQINGQNIQELAQSEVICVLLPAADLYMKCAYPKARALIDGGARVALATDFNPGSSPTQDLSLVGLLARLEMKMTLPEVFAAYTIAPAFALDLQNEVGSLEKSKSANFFSSANDWDQFFYSAGDRQVESVFTSGKMIFSKSKHLR